MSKVKKKKEYKQVYQCYSCGKVHQTPETVTRLRCNHTKITNSYCDTVCFKWRYYEPRYNPTRYDKPKLFGRATA